MSALHLHMGVGRERYAVPVADVAEVAELGEVTPVPGTPDCVLGIRNLRGRILTVADLASLVGIDSLRDARRLAVVERDGVVLGLAVGDLLGVAPVEGDLEPAVSPLVLGTTFADDALVGVLALDAVLEAVKAAAR